MSVLRFRFLELLPALTPVNAVLATGDRVLDALAKLQGQINATRAPTVYMDTAKGDVTQTVTVPDGVTRIWFELHGPGAPGAVGSDGQTAGGGGGAGACMEGSLEVTPGQVISYRVPNAGSANPAWLLASSGNSALVCGAGSAGQTSGIPGGGGVATVGSDHVGRVISSTGGDGGFGDVKGLLSGDNIIAGYGGSNWRGIGGRGGRNTSTSAGHGGAGKGFGAGGGGAANGSSAGPGAAAVLVIRY